MHKMLNVRFAILAAFLIEEKAANDQRKAMRLLGQSGISFEKFSETDLAALKDAEKRAPHTGLASIAPKFAKAFAEQIEQDKETEKIDGVGYTVADAVKDKTISGSLLIEFLTAKEGKGETRAFVLRSAIVSYAIKNGEMEETETETEMPETKTETPEMPETKTPEMPKTKTGKA